MINGNNETQVEGYGKGILRVVISIEFQRIGQEFFKNGGEGREYFIFGNYALCVKDSYGWYVNQYRFLKVSGRLGINDSNNEFGFLQET